MISALICLFGSLYFYFYYYFFSLPCGLIVLFLKQEGIATCRDLVRSGPIQSNSLVAW